MTTTTTKEDEEDESLYVRARRFYGHQSIRNTGLKKPGRLFKKRGTMPTFPTMSSILCNCPHYKLAGSNEAFKWGLQFLKEMSTFIFRDQCIFNEAWPSMFCQSLIQKGNLLCWKGFEFEFFFRRSKRPAFEADYILHFILCLYCLEGGFILSCINTYRSHANLADKESPKTNKFFEGLFY